MTQIVFIIPSRKNGNVTFGLENLFRSIAENADDISNCEAVVVIDDDDDKSYYYAIQEKFANLKTQIIISETRHGYFNLHKYWDLGFKASSHSAKMYCYCTDDIQITKKGFDTHLLKIDAAHKDDNTYIVHSINMDRLSRFGKMHKNNIIFAPECEMMHYLFTTGGMPYSFFPFVSKKIIDIAYGITNIMNPSDNWKGFLNCYAADWYIGYISNLMRDGYLANRVYFENIITRDMRTVADHHQKGDAYDFPSYKYLFSVFFDARTIHIIKFIYLEILRNANQKVYSGITIDNLALLENKILQLNIALKERRGGVEIGGVEEFCASYPYPFGFMIK